MKSYEILWKKVKGTDVASSKQLIKYDLWVLEGLWFRKFNKEVVSLCLYQVQKGMSFA